MSEKKIKIAFVGQRTYFESASLSTQTNLIEPYFLDFRSGTDSSSLLARLFQLKPDVMIVFRPEIYPNSIFSEINALKIGWFTEPTIRLNQNTNTQQYSHPIEEFDVELNSRLVDAAINDLTRRFEQTKELDSSQFDLYISYDPYVAESINSQIVPIWKSLPLPVDDLYFSDPKNSQVPPRIGFFGRPTEHRDQYLNKFLHEFDIRYFAHGVFGNDMKMAFENLEVGINIHNERYLNYENRVSLHLAASHLVISEPLSPTHGLEAGSDFIEFQNPTDFEIILREIWQYPDAFMQTRLNGRRKAEYFRASAVYDKLINELVRSGLIPN